MAVCGHTAIDIKTSTRKRLINMGAKRNSVSYDTVINRLCDFYEQHSISQPFTIPADAQADFVTSLRNLVDSISMPEPVKEGEE